MGDVICGFDFRKWAGMPIAVCIDSVERVAVLDAYRCALDGRTDPAALLR